MVERLRELKQLEYGDALVLRGVREQYGAIALGAQHRAAEGLAADDRTVDGCAAQDVGEGKSRDAALRAHDGDHAPAVGEIQIGEGRREVEMRVGRRIVEVEDVDARLASVANQGVAAVVGQRNVASGILAER